MVRNVLLKAHIGKAGRLRGPLINISLRNKEKGA